MTRVGFSWAREGKWEARLLKELSGHICKASGNSQSSSGRPWRRLRSCRARKAIWWPVFILGTACPGWTLKKCQIPFSSLMPACPHHLFSSPSLHPSILTQPTSPSSFYFVFFCHRAGISLASTFPCLHHGSDPADFFFFYSYLRLLRAAGRNHMITWPLWAHLLQSPLPSPCQLTAFLRFVLGLFILTWLYVLKC